MPSTKALLIEIIKLKSLNKTKPNILDKNEFILSKQVLQCIIFSKIYSMTFPFLIAVDKGFNSRVFRYSKQRVNVL